MNKILSGNLTLSTYLIPLLVYHSYSYHYNVCRPPNIWWSLFVSPAAFAGTVTWCGSVHTFRYLMASDRVTMRLTLAFMTVSNMIHKLHGQPQSYDKKCVFKYCSDMLTPRTDCGVQVTVQIRKDFGSRNIWRGAGSRLSNRKGCSQDHPEEECQGQRADGVR